MQEKIEKTFFDFKVLVFELVALNTRFYWVKIPVIGWQYVNKHFQDFRYYQNKIFGADFVSELSKNMTKILQWKFMQGFGRFNMLTALIRGFFGFSVTSLFAVYNFSNK